MAKSACNQGLTIARNGTKFTASWTIKVKSNKRNWQKFRWRVFNGYWRGWNTSTIGKNATSKAITIPATWSMTAVQIQTQIDSTARGKTPSDWSSSSAIFYLSAPEAPTLNVSIDSANKTTFTWESNANATNGGMYDRCYYRTKCDNNPSSASGWSNWAPANSNTYTYTDNVQGKTRVFQIYARGPAGNSAIKTQYHYLGAPPIATWASDPVSYTDKGSYYQMTYNTNLNGDTYQIDSVVPQYYIGTPDANINCPSGASWTDGQSFSFGGNKAYALTANTNDIVGPDECLWGRVKTIHDSIESYSNAHRIITGVMTAPELTLSVGTITQSGFTVGVTVDDAGTDVPGAYMEVYLEKASAPGLENYILIGTIANGSSSASIVCTEDITGESGYGLHIRNVSADGVTMRSSFFNYETTMPVRPTLNSVSPTDFAGKVYLAWTNNWTEATGTIIAWTDDPDNWMSNDDPSTYEITELASNWFITNLETGKKWYFRIRSVKSDADGETLSPWSDDIPIDLASAPAVPVLYLSDETITEDGMITAYWSHVSTDGTGQIASNIVEATFSNGVWTYGDTVAATTDAQHVDIFAEEQGWTNGSIVYLALQTRSGSGGMSDYSTPVQLVIAAKPTIEITDTDFDTTETRTEYFLGDGSTTTFNCAYDLTTSPTVKVNGSAATAASYSHNVVTLSTAPSEGAEIEIIYTTSDNNILSEMPFECTVDTTNAEKLTLAIERAYAYPMLRPDGTQTDGAEGETVYVKTFPADASNTISIAIDDVIGRLDDGAWYYLVASATDPYKQTVETRILFRVHWSHQSWEPTATFITNITDYIARITPVAGADYVLGDTCDIYRLSADQPELIISGGEFGTEYVDPFPAFGPNSGYKVVTVTENNDYITEDNTFAEYDTIEEEESGYVQLDPGILVIDFAGDRVELPYNITLGNSWTKDFKRTAYLGGHVTGDYNKGVMRDLSATTVLVRGDNDGVDRMMRELSRYPGLCHVRTPEGSSFVADVQVSESMPFNTPIIDYSLSIQKVDPVGYDGMTYAEWSEQQ